MFLFQFPNRHCYIFNCCYLFILSENFCRLLPISEGMFHCKCKHCNTSPKNHFVYQHSGKTCKLCRDETILLNSSYLLPPCVTSFLDFPDLASYSDIVLLSLLLAIRGISLSIQDHIKLYFLMYALHACYLHVLYVN